jgi:hypothetical protein
VSNEAFSVGDLVEVILAKPNEPACVGMRGTVIEVGVADWTGVEFVRVDYAGHLVYSRPKVLRKIPPPKREPTSTWDNVIVWRPKETSHV